MSKPPEIPEHIWQALQKLYQMHEASGGAPARFGERFELITFCDPYTVLRPGDRGTLIDEHKDGLNVPYAMLWDCGSSLSVFPHEVRPLGQKILPEDLSP